MLAGATTSYMYIASSSYARSLLFIFLLLIIISFFFYYFFVTHVYIRGTACALSGEKVSPFYVFFSPLSLFLSFFLFFFFSP